MNPKHTYLGIELGSTKIKSVLIDGIRTYSMDAVHMGLRECWQTLAEDYRKAFGEPLTPFRTWRNRITGEAAACSRSIQPKNAAMSSVPNKFKQCCTGMRQRFLTWIDASDQN